MSDRERRRTRDGSLGRHSRYRDRTPDGGFRRVMKSIAARLSALRHTSSESAQAGGRSRPVPSPPPRAEKRARATTPRASARSSQRNSPVRSQQRATACSSQGAGSACSPPCSHAHVLQAPGSLVSAASAPPALALASLASPAARGPDRQGGGHTRSGANGNRSHCKCDPIHQFYGNGPHSRCDPYHRKVCEI